jgi:hypothetical protein
MAYSSRRLRAMRPSKLGASRVNSAVPLVSDVGLESGVQSQEGDALPSKLRPKKRAPTFEEKRRRINETFT